MQYSAFFFDFDGVLADSVEVKSKAFAHLFEEYGTDIVGKVVDYHKRHGEKTRTEKFKYYYEEYLGKSLQGNELSQLCKRFSELVVDKVVESPEIVGSGEFLTRCYKQIPCYIVSSTPQEEIREIVSRRKIDNYFEGVFGAPDTKVEIVNRVLLEKKYLARECLFFGDAESDYVAAHVCNVNFFGIVSDTHAPLLQTYPNIKWANKFHNLPLGL